MVDLRKRRKELGLTMKQVAEVVGVSEATISRYESGNIKNMRRDRIDKYARILKVDVLDIVSWDNYADAFAEEVNDDYETLNTYLRKVFDSDDETALAHRLVEELPRLNALGLQKLLERIEELARLDEYKSDFIRELENAELEELKN